MKCNFEKLISNTKPKKVLETRVFCEDFNKIMRLVKKYKTNRSAITCEIITNALKEIKEGGLK